MNGFGFVEYEDPMDAKDVVPGKYLRHRCWSTLTLPAFHGSEFKGERLTVQFARGPRRKDDFGPSDRNVPRPRRTIYRMNITGLVPETSWQVRMIIFPYTSYTTWKLKEPHESFPHVHGRTQIELLTLGLGFERLRTKLWSA